MKIDVPYWLVALDKKIAPAKNVLFLNNVIFQKVFVFDFCIDAFVNIEIKISKINLVRVTKKYLILKQLYDISIIFIHKIMNLDFINYQQPMNIGKNSKYCNLNAMKNSNAFSLNEKNNQSILLLK